jgi:hypothetical protein
MIISLKVKRSQKFVWGLPHTEFSPGAWKRIGLKLKSENFNLSRFKGKKSYADYKIC